MHHLYSPERLRLEVLDAEIPINYKTQCRKLA
jgi:hypothetical protein